MSARLVPQVAWRPMCATDLDQVMSIEPTLYSHPWTRGNFDDSLKAGYSCWVAEREATIVGYGVLMIGFREAHLLNVSVAVDWQRQGLGRALLEKFVELARRNDTVQLLLEVRPSNEGARRLYAGFGFREISVRRGYYPAGGGREDAILMGLVL